MPDIHKNPLFYGDNLPILRERIADESVDLIYLDPPFNSSRMYNVLFKDESGKESEAQIAAFDDTWHWNAAAEQTYQDLATTGASQVSAMISALRQFIGGNQNAPVSAFVPQPGAAGRADRHLPGNLAGSRRRYRQILCQTQVRSVFVIT